MTREIYDFLRNFAINSEAIGLFSSFHQNFFVRLTKIRYDGYGKIIGKH